MRLNKWLYLFWTTLVAGGGSALAAGLYLQLMDQEFEFLGTTGLGFNIATMVMGGLMFSIISQMGFFAYLTVNYIAMSILKKKYWWSILQVLLIVVVLVDLVSLRYTFFSGNSILAYSRFPAIMLLIALGIAYWKVKLTNKTAFIPTLFFISVGTILEAVPAIKMDNAASIFFMTTPLLACNAWQILNLHKLVNTGKR